MDSDITLLAQGAGATLVTLLTTEAWQRTRDGFSCLWQRMQPSRAETIASELEVSREDILTASTTDDQQTLDELRAQWQGRLRRLLVARPEAAVQLRLLLDELDPTGCATVPPVTQHVTASGHARVYQAGRDQHINER